jgi:hypothetical protein
MLISECGLAEWFALGLLFSISNQQSEFSHHQLQEKADLMIRAGLLGRRAAVILMITIAAATVTTAGQRSSKQPYFPARGEWQKKDPSAVGLDKAKLHDAIPSRGQARTA